MQRGIYAGIAAGLALAGIGWLRRRGQQPSIGHGDKRWRIVVAGAGFAGLSLLEEISKHLAPGEVELTAVDRHNYHLFTPLLYQVATASVEPASIAYPLRPFCHEHAAQLVTAEILAVDLDNHVLETNEGKIEYDVLVLGLGSQTNYFGMREVEERSFGLKSLGGANAIRRNIITCVEEATTTEDPERRQRLLSFAVVGAGATGAELVGSIHDLLYENLVPYYPQVNRDDVQIHLIEAADTILPGINPKLRQIAMDRFRELGIDVRLKTMVSGIEDGQVIVKDADPIPTQTVIWTAGVRANSIAADLPVEKNRDGRVKVDEYLRIPSHPNVFVLGDNAYAPFGKEGKPFPPNAAVAVQEGKQTAPNIARLVRGEPLVPFRYRRAGELIALGRGNAAAEIGPTVFSGIPAWLFWRVFYLYRLMGVKNRAGVVVDWAGTVFARRYIANTEA